MNEISTYSKDFLERVDSLKADLYKRQKEASNLKTPKSKIKKKGKFNFVSDDYMRDKLNKYFPGWSWVDAGSTPAQAIGIYWILISGKLRIPDFSIITPDGKIFFREFFSPAAHRIQYPASVSGQQKEYNPPDMIDLGNDVKAANTDALKKAINMLTNIADDVYGKEMTKDLDSKLQDKINSIKEQLTPEQKDTIDNYINEFGGIEDIDEETANDLIERMESKIN